MENIRKLQENTTALYRMATLPSGVRTPDVNIRVESVRQPGVNGGAHPGANGGNRVQNGSAHPGVNGGSRV